MDSFWHYILLLYTVRYALKTSTKWLLHTSIWSRVSWTWCWRSASSYCDLSDVISVSLCSSCLACCISASATTYTTAQLSIQLPSNMQYLSNDDCRQHKEEEYQTCSALYCVRQTFYLLAYLLTYVQCFAADCNVSTADCYSSLQGPDLQNILRQT